VKVVEAVAEAQEIVQECMLAELQLQQVKDMAEVVALVLLPVMVVVVVAELEPSAEAA
jgi:hypothetical protein